MNGFKKDNEKCLHFVGFELAFCARFISKLISFILAIFIMHNMPYNSQSACIKMKKKKKKKNAFNRNYPVNMLPFSPRWYIRLTAIKHFSHRYDVQSGFSCRFPFDLMCVLFSMTVTMCMCTLPIMVWQRLKTICSGYNFFPYLKIIIICS